MKKLFLLFAGLFSTAALFAQLQKGTVLLGGNVGFNNVSADGVSTTVINLSPQALFFTSNRFAVGGLVGVAVQTGNGFDATSISIGPAVRFYFNDSGNSRFFGQFDLGFQSVSSQGFSTEAGVIGLGIGADFFLNDRVAIEGVLGYRRAEVFEGGGGFNQIGLNFGVAAFIGRGGGE